VKKETKKKTVKSKGSYYQEVKIIATAIIDTLRQSSIEK